MIHSTLEVFISSCNTHSAPEVFISSCDAHSAPKVIIPSCDAYSTLKVKTPYLDAQTAPKIYSISKTPPTLSNLRVDEERWLFVEPKSFNIKSRSPNQLTLSRTDFLGQNMRKLKNEFKKCIKVISFNVLPVLTIHQ